MREHPHPLSVLVVDDCTDTAGSMAELLARYGYDVRVAGCGAAALAADTPDIVLLDIGLPDVSGWEVAARLRDRPGKQPIVVAVSGYGTDGDRHRSEAAGVDLHLVKPVDPAVLVGMLRRFRRALAPSLPLDGRLA